MMSIAFTCPHCGLQTIVGEEYAGRSGPCARCGQMVTVPPLAGTPPPSADLGQDPMMRMIMPVGRSGLAIAAGYAGLFAVLMCPAPIAFALGILAIRDIKKHPEKHGMGRAIFGLVMGAIFTLALILFLVVAAIQGLSH